MQYIKPNTQGIQLPEIWKPLPRISRSLQAPFDGNPYLLRIGGLAWQGHLQGNYWNLADGPLLPCQSSRNTPKVTDWLPLSALDPFRHTSDTPAASHSVIVQEANGGHWRNATWSATRRLWVLPDLQLDRSAPVRRSTRTQEQIPAWVDLEEIVTTLWRKSLLDTEVAW